MALQYGNWSIVRELGKGSFGTVYEIEKSEFGYVYRAALKVIHISKTMSRKKREPSPCGEPSLANAGEQRKFPSTKWIRRRNAPNGCRSGTRESRSRRSRRVSFGRCLLFYMCCLLSWRWGYLDFFRLCI